LFRHCSSVSTLQRQHKSQVYPCHQPAFLKGYLNFIMKLGFIISILTTALLVCPCKNEAVLQIESETDLPTLTNECSDPPLGQCSFYEDCLETQYHCGPNGYPIGYGLKYCEKFKLAHSTLSTQGQSWMMNTMKCLQYALVIEGTGGVGAVKTCNQLKNKAFDSHARCYLENGLCNLPPSDWKAIVDIVSLKTMFSSWKAMKETLEAAKGCLGFYSFLLQV